MNDEGCVFAPANEPWTCLVHQGIRTSLDEPQCDIARPAEPFTMAYIDNLRQAGATGRYPTSRYVVRRLLATIDALDVACVNREAIEALPRYTSPDGEETWVEWAALRDVIGNTDARPAAPALDMIASKVTALAHLTPEDWAERRGADPIARTINAVLDIIREAR